MNPKSFKLTLCALLAALVAAGSLFSLPLPPPLPPVTLAVFFALLAGALLGPIWGGASLALYLFLGSLGLPVFANGSGGLGHFASPTGGFLLGYLAAAVVTGLLADRTRWNFARNLVAALAGVAALYAVGLPWFRAVIDARPDRDMSMLGALGVMAPYLAGDAVKALAMAALLRALKPILVNRLPARSREKVKA
ncbi:MAG TPA: biotin transporter BioY [Spirochaetales bacterium]|nr:biotin transporter BioY [Spirochaetales bacterium]